ncbi:acyltransferase family protein [Demequina aurantiaca]|uniref:acyltransferase family protein n=1 Tax=Demequina aurantiaca TaxID=676200 RepID=UPI0007823562|nr:acyltransferase [Demequina aurantiaca]
MAETSVTVPSTPDDKRPAVSRLYALDGLRFLAALAVLAFHFTARSNNAWGQPVETVFPQLSFITGLGAFGVDIFFVISGFVILMTAWNAGVPKFAASRISRLFPAYWACVALSSLLLLVIWRTGGAIVDGGSERSATDAATNFTMVQRAFGIGDVDGVYWTLWAELRFYILIGIFVAIGITTRRVLAFCFIWPILSGIALTTDSALLSEVLVAEWAPLFSAGMALFIVKRDPRNLMAWLVVAFTTLLAAGYSGQVTLDRIVNGLTNRDFPPYVGWVIVVGSIGLVALLTLTRMSQLGGKKFLVLGALTYPLYLLHEYWGWWIISLLEDKLPAFAVLALATGFCIALAWAVYYFVERNTVSRMRRRLEKDLVKL